MLFVTLYIKKAWRNPVNIDSEEMGKEKITQLTFVNDIALNIVFLL